MRRQLKFRMWCDSLKVMYTPDNQIGGLWSIPEASNGILKPKDDNDVLMQFTGLIDMNGTEIYEGDIVEIMEEDWSFTDDWDVDDDRWTEDKHFNPMPMVKTGTDVVTMNRLRFWLKNEQSGWEGEDYVDPENCKVIGNIYENPELIK